MRSTSSTASASGVSSSPSITTATTSTTTNLEQVESNIVTLLLDTQQLLQSFDDAVLPPRAADDNMPNTTATTASVTSTTNLSSNMTTSLKNAPVHLQSILTRSQRIRDALSIEIANTPKPRVYTTPYIYNQIATMEYNADATNFIKDRLEEIIETMSIDGDHNIDSSTFTTSDIEFMR